MGQSQYFYAVLMLAFATLTCLPSGVSAQQLWSRWKRQVPQDEYNPWRSPLERFDKYVHVRMNYYGEFVKGFSIPMYLEDTVWDPDWSEYPQWFLRRINCFLGIPYAMAPVGERRFQRAKPPSWRGTWDATYFRPACPQDLNRIQEDIPEFQKVNISEDCLYMNVFVPNRTQPKLKEDTAVYPVIVYIHSGDFSSGTSQAQPGHVLTLQNVVVVTFNYRLGALGYLTTEDENAPGNWGFSDQVQALDFVKKNIGAFRGDPTRITLMGDTAGAVSVGLHLVSPASRRKGYYHQVIMMSGTDLSLYGVVRPFYRPRMYAEKLAISLGCPTDDTYTMIECLRSPNRTWEEFVDAQRRIIPNDGTLTNLSVVWAPTQDGGFFALKTELYLPEMPSDMRQQGNFEHVPAIVGINAQDGAEVANRTIEGLRGGISTEVFEQFLMKLMSDWRIIDVYQERAAEAIGFQYTYWPDPDNRTARGQEFINMLTDLWYGIGMDRVVKLQCEYAPTYTYVFRWKSYTDWLPWYLGASYSSIVGYALGYPFLNDTILNETMMLPRQWYDYDDMNISDFMMYMFTSFAKYGDPTPNITRNVTWQSFNLYNFTYLEINWHSYIWFRYRQSHYGFWNEYFPRMASQNYFYPTATPTPEAYEYVVATGCVSALLILLLGTMILLIYLLYYQHRKAEEALYRHEPPQRHEAPYTLPTSRTQGSISFNTSGSSKSTVMTAAQYGSAYPMSAAQYAASPYGGSQSSLSIKQPQIHHSVV